MVPINEPSPPWLTTLWLIFVAVFGGVAKSLNAWLNEEAAVSVKRLLATAVTSGFSGWMVGQTMLHFDKSWQLVGAGLGGYMGVEAIDYIMRVLKQRIPPAGNST